MAPLAGSAQGKLGGAYAAGFKGGTVVRRAVPPQNPNSTTQALYRWAFRQLMRWWARQPDFTHTIYNHLATTKAALPHSLFIKQFIKNYTLYYNGYLTLFYPGDPSTLPPTYINATRVAPDIWVAVEGPTPPAGWTRTAIHLVYTRVNQTGWAQDISEAILITYHQESSDLLPVFVCSGLPPATWYQFWALIEWLLPSGEIRYSTSIFASQHTD